MCGNVLGNIYEDDVWDVYRRREGGLNFNNKKEYWLCGV
jgi:hypothetical protein